MTGVKRSVESRLKDPNVASLINALYTALAEVYSIKAEASGLYNVGELGPQTAAKFEVTRIDRYKDYCVLSTSKNCVYYMSITRKFIRQSILK